jgi:hypothetical protein
VLEVFLITVGWLGGINFLIRNIRKKERWIPGRARDDGVLIGSLFSVG